MSKAAELAALIGSQTALSNRNLVINGACAVSQRSTSVSSVTSGGYKTVDRFGLTLNSSGTFTVSQSSTAPEGFANSLKFDCTTADASPDYFIIEHKIEGQNLQQLKKGTSNAESVTLSFYVRSSKTGTYQVNLRDNDNSRQIGSTYAISSANTWERKEITFAGDTTGAFDNDNASSLEIEWWLAAGSTYNSGAVPTAWEAQSNGDRAAGLNVAIGASTSDDFHITGVQLEIGEQGTPFEHRSFGDELARCQRYYERYSGWTEAEATLLLSGRILSSNRNDACYFFRTKKRAVPSLTMISDNGSGGTSPSIVVFPSDATSETLSFISAAITGANTCSASIRTTGGATLTNGHNSTTMMATDFAFDAEL
jgi:hypothetical protein